MAYTPRDTLHIVAFPFGVSYCLDEAPKRVPSEPDGDQAEQESSEGLCAYRLEDAARVGSATSCPHHCSDRQHAYNRVHCAFGHIPEPREPLDPRTRLLGSFLRATLGFLSGVLPRGVARAQIISSQSQCPQMPL